MEGRGRRCSGRPAFLARADPPDRPAGVLGDQRVGIGGGPLEGGEVVGGAGVAERDADVAQEAGALDALDRGLGEEGAECVVVEGEEVAQRVVRRSCSRAWKRASRAVSAKRFHGQTSRQSSQP